MMSTPANWLRFRIDPEPSGDPSVRSWRARRFHETDCYEFLISVELEKRTLSLSAREYSLQVVGTNLSRELPYLDRPKGASPVNPFRESPEGSWTVLKVFIPEETKPFFLLGLNSALGQGMIVLGPASSREPLESLLGLVPATDADD